LETQTQPLPPLEKIIIGKRLSIRVMCILVSSTNAHNYFNYHQTKI
jgi:hypothetical protein